MRLLFLLLIAPFLLILLIPVGAIALGIGAAVIGVVVGVIGAIFGAIVAVVTALFAGVVSIGAVSGVFFGKLLFALVIVAIILALAGRKRSSAPPAKTQ